MAFQINETHDPKLKSWVESANDPETDFPIQNLPFCVFRPPGRTRRENKKLPRVGVAIGELIFDLFEALREDLFDGVAEQIGALHALSSLNLLMSHEQDQWSELRSRTSQLLRKDNTEIQSNRDLTDKLLVPISESELLMPAEIGDYTDFYASIYHAANIGKMFRPDNPLLPNYKWIPIGYHGRASSVVMSGAPIHRPLGQTKDDEADTPVFGPTGVLDYELEVGVFVGRGNERGVPVKITEAEDHIFGLCLVNDWSARDLQRWEYQPLGPFLSKSFATTISPWIVTMEALAPFRAPQFKRPAGDPEPLPYLDSRENSERGGFDIKLEVLLLTQRMRENGIAPHRLSGSNAKELYWTFAQMLTHHTSNGCNLRPGDLVASGTVSGPTKESYGCLIELTQRGAEPINLPTGETRKFLQDGDEVIIRGCCEREGFRRIGLGECRGTIMPTAPQ
jgi:fumarylacetoacetase